MPSMEDISVARLLNLTGLQPLADDCKLIEADVLASASSSRWLAGLCPVGRRYFPYFLGGASTPRQTPNLKSSFRIRRHPGPMCFLIE